MQILKYSITSARPVAAIIFLKMANMFPSYTNHPISFNNTFSFYLSSISASMACNFGFSSPRKQANSYTKHKIAILYIVAFYNWVLWLLGFDCAILWRLDKAATKLGMLWFTVFLALGSRCTNYFTGPLLPAKYSTCYGILLRRSELIVSRAIGVSSTSRIHIVSLKEGVFVLVSWYFIILSLCYRRLLDWGWDFWSLVSRDWMAALPYSVRKM